MRFAYIVTEFPKVTETFILRDLVEFDRCGHDIRVYHLTTARRGEFIHAFGKHLLPKVRYQPFLLSGSVFGALFRAMFRHPVRLMAVIGRITVECLVDPVTLLKSLAILPKSLAFAEELAGWGADHVHAEFAGHPATAAWIIGRFTDIPYSVSCRAHDIFITQALLGPKLREAAFVRTISTYNRQFLLDRFPDLAEKRIEIIHSGIDAMNIGPVDGMPEDPFVVLYVGSLEARKGVDTLLRALAQVDGVGEWRCEVIGGGPAAKSLHALADRLGISGRVDFLGQRPSEEVAAAYARASVVVVPSIIGPRGRTEGIPNVIMEALAHTRPVVATDVSGVPELVEHKISGLLVPPGDVGALAEAMQQIRNAPEDAARMANEGRARVLAEFNVATNAKAQLALFQDYSAKREKRVS